MLFSFSWQGFAGAGTLGLMAWIAVSVQDDERDPRVLIGSVGFTHAEVEQMMEFSPLPEAPEDVTNAVFKSPAAARLGQAIFFDKRFSANGEVACSTCHDPAKGWADGRQFGRGIGNLERNSMSLWNVAYNRWFFWDGRRDSLWSQALTPLEVPAEHGTSRLAVAHALAADPDYRRAYRGLFGELPDLSDDERFPPSARPVDGQPEHPEDRAWRAMGLGDRETINRIFSNVGKAVAAFERGIVSNNSPFDQYVRGLRTGDPIQQRALSDSAKAGLRLFMGKARCFLCHNGPNFSDLEFHNDRVRELLSESGRSPGRYAGVKLVQRDPFNGIGKYSDDTGGEARAKVGYLKSDGHALAEFKTPSLRNVASTAPYMHQGQLATLDDVLNFYSTFEGAMPMDKGSEKLLLPLALSAKERAHLRDFLFALSDANLPPAMLSAPPKPYLD